MSAPGRPVSAPLPFSPGDWTQVELVAFDVDGTLYDQRALRPRMARDLLLQVLRRRELRPLSVVARYRRLREALGDAEAADFEARLLSETAAASHCTEAEVRAIVAEWVEQRPLPYLARCRYAGVAELFDGLRRHGKRIGVLSDYPARDKLAALGLQADVVVSANDADVGLLKPHPRGLQHLMQQAAASPAGTLLIGDRVERDGLAARRAGARCLIRSTQPHAGWQTFGRFDEPLFAPMLARVGG